MSPTAFLFAGQGVDMVSSAMAFARGSSRARELFDLAARGAHTDSERLFARGGRELASTRFAQPVLVALCLGIAEELRSHGIQADYAAGHSLGELTAWSALDAIGTEDAIDLAGERGRLMAREAERHPGGMLALVDANRSAVDVALRLGGTRGALALAARNAVDEWVLSGEEPALSLVAASFRSVRLRTPGAWHSPAMAGAVKELARALHAVPRSKLSGALVANGTGAVVEHEQEIPSLLAEQLVRPVDWVAVLQTLRGRGVRQFVTVGPGNVLRGLLRKNFGSEVCVLSTETPSELDETIGRLKS
jgi:[acyl-carrier-protein] S-malonyltransferase